MLLEYGADVNYRGSTSQTALMKASNLKHTEVVKLLMDAQRNQQTKRSGSALVNFSQKNSREKGKQNKFVWKQKAEQK